MPSDYLVTNLLTAVRESGFLPAAEVAGDARILSILNREQRGYLTKLLLSAREEYQTVDSVVTLVQGQTDYRIPARAVGARLKQVVLRDTAGRETPLTPAPLGASSIAKAAGTGQYAFAGLFIRLFDSGLNLGSLVLRHYRRLNKLVTAAEAGEVSSFDTTAKTVTLVSAPAAWSATQSYDFVQGSPHFDVLAADQSASIASNVLTFTALPSELAIGDYIAKAGQTPICNAPLELHDVLVARGVFMYWLGQGDPKASAARATLEEISADTLSLIQPRVTDSDQVLVNYNGPGWNRWRRRRLVR